MLGQKEFLARLAQIGTSPIILVRLLSYDSVKGLSERFNPVLLRLLNDPDKQVRHEALRFVLGNDSSSRAPMWRIAFDKPVLDRVEELTKQNPL